MKSIQGKSSAGNRLEGSIGQTRRVLLDITSDYNPRSLINSIKHYFEQSDDVMEVLIFKGKKEISIEREYFYDRNYIKNFLQSWAK